MTIHIFTKINTHLNKKTNDEPVSILTQQPKQRARVLHITNSKVALELSTDLFIDWASKTIFSANTKLF